MRTGHKQYFVEYESDKYNRSHYCRETGEYGCFLHDGGNPTNRAGRLISDRKRRKNP